MKNAWSKTELVYMKISTPLLVPMAREVLQAVKETRKKMLTSNLPCKFKTGSIATAATTRMENAWCGTELVCFKECM